MRPILFIAPMLLCVACQPPKPPPTEQPPEPQAAQPGATPLRDAIQAPLDKAKSVEDTLKDASDRQRADIETAGG